MASSRCSLDGGGATAASTPTTTTPASDDLSRRSGDAREKGDIFDPAAAAAVVAATAAAAVDSSCQQQQQQHQQQASSLDGSASGVDDDNDDDDDCCCDDASVYSPASFESARKHPTVAATAPAAAQQPPLSASSSSASSVPPLPPAEEEEAEAVVMDDDELDDAFDEMGDASDDARPKKTTTKPAPVTAFNFSFALGGWLMIYNFGVAKCLLDHGLHKVDPERQSIIGSSAGSLSAAALVLEADIDKIVDQAKTSFIPRAHNAKILGFVYGMFFIGTFLKESMLECLPVSRVPDKTSVPGRLIVVMSSLLGWGSIRAKEFDNGQELIDALRCSCAIFPLVMPHRFRGKRCFDGFFSEGTSAPTLDDEESAGLETVSISPFYASSASIRPSRYVPLSWIALAPRDPAAIDWLYDLGYRDALFWMAKRGIEHTCTHHPRRSKEHQKETHESPATARSKAGGCCGSSSAGVGVGASGSGSGSGSTKLGAGKSAFEEGDSDDDDDCGVADAWASAKDLPSPSKSSGGIGCGGGGGESLKAGSSEQWAGKKGTSADVIAGRIEGSSDGGVEGVGGGGGGGGDASGGEGGAAKKGIGGGYLRKSFVLSGCHMRPQRERHPQLDEPAFVPSLEQFVGHGSYNAVADFLFVVFFNIAWRPATALLLYADLISRLFLATIRGVWMELRELLGWIIPALVLAGVCLERGPTKQECSAMLAGVAGLLVIACSRERCASAGEWRTARRCVRGLFDRRILLSCLPWGHRGNVRSEALESSFLYRAVSFFM